MSAFAESPVFFFMDNMPPILSVKVPKDVRKIVELSDTGCDARSALANFDRSYSPKLPGEKSDDDFVYSGEERPKFCEGRPRVQNDRIAVDVEKSRCNRKNDAPNQQSWPGQFQYETAISDKELGRKLECCDLGPRSKTTPPKVKPANRWRPDSNPYEILPHSDCNPTPQTVPKNLNVSTKDRPVFRSPPRVPKLLRPSLFAKDPRIENQEAIPSRENHLDYPEDFETSRNPRSSSKISKDYDRRTNSVSHDSAKNPADSASRRTNSRSLKYVPKSAGASVPSKWNDSSKDWNEEIANRVRSRTRSPPKRARPFQKPCFETVDRGKDQSDGEFGQREGRSKDVECDRTKNMNSVRSTKTFKQVMDRAVDGDSSMDALNFQTSTERGPPATGDEFDDEGRSTKNGFWEFVPLNGEDDRECATASTSKRTVHPRQNEEFQSNLLGRRWSKDAGTKKTWAKKEIGNEEPDRSRNSFNFSRDDLLPSLIPQNIKATHEENSRAADRSKNREQRHSESKSQSKLCKKLFFGYAKRSSNCGSSDEKKEVEDAIDVCSVVDEGKNKSNVEERNAACLKRKLDKSRTSEAEALVNRPTGMEKKIRSEKLICSKLPIRVGIRHRSRNPTAAVAQSGVKSCVSEAEKKQEESKESTESSDERARSARSRTKPKSKPSVTQNRVVVDAAEALENLQSIGDVKWLGDTEENLSEQFLERSQAQRNNDASNLQRDSSMGTCFQDEKFEGNIEEKGPCNFEVCDEEEQRKRYSTSLNFGRKAGHRKQTETGAAKSCAKEKCCFYVDDAVNVACNNYCDKDQRNVDPFRTKKSIIVTSRY